MDPGSAALVLGGTRLLYDVWKDWRIDRKEKQGMVLDAQGHFEMIPTNANSSVVQRLIQIQCNNIILKCTQSYFFVPIFNWTV